LKNTLLQKIEHLPNHLERAIEDLDEAQLQTPYRDGGWTVQQVTHHLADANVNMYIRVKKALTENNPTAAVYDQNAWAELADVKTIHPQVSVDLVKALNARLLQLFSSLKNDDWNKTVYHSERKTELTIWNLLGMYVWHTKHHTAHITELRKRMRW
jgi:hypothetical protein